MPSLIHESYTRSSITLTALFYYLLKNPACYAKLQHELTTLLPARDPTSLECDVDFSQAQKLPYMHACIQENFRMHPASAILLERVVPAGGANIGGEQIPGGTVVGVASWAVHRNKAVFGEDVKTFRPERWLEASEGQVRLMEKTMLHFGQGNHMCLGRNISAREIYKLVPTLLRTFKVSSDIYVSAFCIRANVTLWQMTLAEPEKDWTLVTGLNVKPHDVNVRIERIKG